MSQHICARRARSQLEHLEDRCTPSALLGHPWAHAPALPGEPPALAAPLATGTEQHTVPIKLSARITSDGTGVLSLTGNGSHLGRWTGQGSIDSVVIDAAAGRVAISATVTIVAANGDRLFVSVSVSLSLATGPGEETIIFTGGTGRFAGASGSATGACDTTWDPATPLTFECNSQGSGTLTFAHAR
jgi:hypothetical protein